MENKKTGGSAKATIIVVIVVISCCLISCLALLGLGYLGYQASENQDAQEQETQADRKSNPKQVGDIMITDSLEWTLISTEDRGQIIPTNREFYGEDCDAGDGNKIILVELSAKNVSSEPFEYFDDTIPVIIDDKDNEYGNGSIDLWDCFDEDYDSYYYDLNPNIEKTVRLSFQVPDSADDLLLRIDLKDDMTFSEDYDYFKID